MGVLILLIAIVVFIFLVPLMAFRFATSLKVRQKLSYMNGINVGNNKEFVDALWNSENKPYEDGYFDAYYDGLLRLFAFMHLSGKYQIIFPE